MKLNKSLFSGLAIILAISGLAVASTTGGQSQIVLTDDEEGGGSGETTTISFDGQGTEEDPYQIKTVQDLKNLTIETTTNAKTFEGIYFKLMNDIDVAGDTAFVGIAADGVAAHSFDGVFDGDNHVVDNIVFNKVGFNDEGTVAPASSVQYCGFIGRLGKTGVIKNLTIGKGSKMTFYMSSGAISGYAAGRIENCTNRGSVTGYYSNIGGIVGSLQKVNGIVTGCHNEGTVTGCYNYVAGIAGINYGTVEHCQNDGNIYSIPLTGASVTADKAKNVGGIIGYLSGSTVRYCINNGDIYSENENAGGIVGYLVSTSAYVSNCINTGYISTKNAGKVVGAIAGYCSSSTIKLCENNIYDSQIGATFGGVNRDNRDGVTSYTTAEMTSGKVLGTFSADSIKFVEGSYPVLARFADTEASKAKSQLVVTFADGEDVNDVKSTAKLSNLEGQSWTLRNNSPLYTISAGQLTVGQITGSETVNDTLIASYNGFTKEIPIKSVPVLFDGDGTEASPYLIKTVADLQKLASQVNDDNAAYDGTYFKQTADLDFTDITDFNGIGYDSAVFGGVYDGDNHTISNLNLNIASGTVGKALFGNVKDSGVIKNLTLKDGKYTTAATANLAGFVLALSGTIENCVNYNEIDGLESGSYSGGIVYQLNGTGQILNCKNYGKISAKKGRASGIVSYAIMNSLTKGCENYGEIATANTSNGGISGYAGGRFESCTNYADLTFDKSNGGGIVGYPTDSCYIVDCVNRGTITASASAGSCFGGIAGYIYGKTKIIGSTNYGDVIVKSTTSLNYTGGIAGRLTAGNTISDTKNYGNVTSENGGYVGGIAGYIVAGNTTKGSGVFERTYNYGNVKGFKQDVGGFAGYLAASNDVTDCGNYGDVEGELYNTAGFNGYGAATTYTRCFNTGNVTNTGYFTAGFTGNGSKSIYTDCFNLGDVTTTGLNTNAANVSAAGMLANGGATFINCYSIGNITAPDKLAGFVAYNPKTNPLTITNCYSSGKVTATNESTSLVAPFLGTNLNEDSTYEGNYYNSDSIAGESVGDVVATAAVAKTTKELTALSLGDAYTNVATTLPYLTWAKDIPQVVLSAAQIEFETETENAGNVTNNIKLGLPEGVAWTSSSNIKIENGVAVVPTSAEAGETATLTKSAGESLSYTYNLVLNIVSGVNSIDAQGKDIKARRFFNLSGQEVSAPANGDVVIEQTIYTDGTGVVRKVTVK